MGRQVQRPVTADRRVRDLRKELLAVERESPGPERAARLAWLTRAALDDRQLNMAMQAASLCLADDPEDPDLLVAAFLDADEHPETQLEALAGLGDLARYLDRPDVGALAEQHQLVVARRWAAAADPGERRYRLRTVASLTSEATADALREELDPTGRQR
jgi:hypothetical protein